MQWKNIIDQIVEHNPESITFTGGEIFFYKDFQDVYTHAYDKGFEIVLMSNALSDTQDLVTVMWANEPFDPNHPDTFFEKV